MLYIFRDYNVIIEITLVKWQSSQNETSVFSDAPLQNIAASILDSSGCDTTMAGSMAHASPYPSHQKKNNSDITFRHYHRCHVTWFRPKVFEYFVHYMIITHKDQPRLSGKRTCSVGLIPAGTHMSHWWRQEGHPLIRVHVRALVKWR